MELRQIRSFLSIAETLHFGRTAELIHLSQPALSLQIRALEEEVGLRLLERDRRKTAPTPAGRARGARSPQTPPPVAGGEPQGWCPPGQTSPPPSRWGCAKPPRGTSGSGPCR